MSNSPDDLAALRREIDSIDEQLHDLLMRRGDVVTEIGRRKAAGGQVTFRPAREAQLLRRLLERHRGALPARAVVRVWREIIAAAIRLQGDLIVGYCPLGGHGAALRLANENFGIDATTVRFERAEQVAAAVARGDVSVGLVPHPQAAEAPGWWIEMGELESVRVVARCPWFVADESDDAPEPEAFVLAASVPEDSGDDCSLFVASCREPVSHERVSECLAAAGLTGRSILEAGNSLGSGGRRHVVEVSGFLDGDDDRMRTFARSLDGAELRWLGACARPYMMQTESGVK